MDSTINRHNLCVTSQHEDEGYLSPSEEDLLRFNSQRLRTGYLDCNKLCDGGSVSLNENLKVGHQNQSELDDQETPWEVIAVQPDIQFEHLSWDKLKLPVPYRFFDAHKLCLRQIRQSPSVSYITDNGKRDAEVVENIWRSGYLHRHSLSQAPTDIENSRSDGFPSFASSSDTQDNELRKDNFFHIPVAQFVQHVFHLVCGRESLSYSRLKDCRFSFRKNPDLLVIGLSPGTIDNFSKTFLNAGRIFRRLSHFAVLHYDDNLMHREGLQRNAVFISFLKFISDYLKLYETSLMLMESKIHSLGRLNVFFQPFLQQLDTLERVLDLYVASDQITFLKGLNSMMLCCETPSVSDLLRGAFIACASAYFRYVSDWIFRGVLTEGFHIQTARSYNYTDRRYWVKQFSQVASVPAFLENVANVIYETGRAVNLLNLIRNTESSNCVLSVVLQDECYSINPKVDFEDVAALENEWMIKVESFYEEFSFLKTDIETVLKQGKKHQSPNQSIDFEAIEAAKQNYERTRLDTRQQALDRKALKQKQLYDSLSAQLAEKKSLEKKKMEDDKLEDEKMAAYIASVDQRDLDEEMRLMKKHFGERVIDTVGVRNVKRRIADTMDSEYILQKDDTSLQSLVSASDESQQHFDVSDGLPQEMGDQPAETIEESVQLVLEKSRRSSKSVTFDEIVHVQTPSGTETSVEALDGKVEEGQKVIAKNCAAVLNTTKEPQELDLEEKFDPDNIKIRPTVPFNTNLDLDVDISESILIPKPIAKSRYDRELLSGKQKIPHHDSSHLSNFLSQSVAIPAKAQNRMVNAALLHYFIVEKQLFQNLEALNDYLCLQNGLFGHFLTTFFVKEVNKGNLVAKEDIPRKTGRLNEILGEALALSADGFGKSEFRDKLGLIMSRENGRNSIDFDGQKSLKSKMLTSKYEVLDDIVLNFSVDWPLSILLTEDLLINYERLFAFQMRLYRTEVLLLDIGTLLKFKGKNSKQFAILNHHRYLMLQFVRAIRHYINVTVIHCAWTDLESTFYKLNSLDRLYEGLVRHIKFVTTNCLLGAKGEGVKKLLLDQLMVIECFCTDVENYCNGVDWNDGDVIEARRFAKIDQKFKVWEEIQKVFIKVVYKLANKGTYQKVSYFLQLFNFNGYFGTDLVE